MLVLDWQCHLGLRRAHRKGGVQEEEGLTGFWRTTSASRSWLERRQDQQIRRQARRRRRQGSVRHIFTPLPFRLPTADTIILVNRQTYTVEFARDNGPLRAYIVGRLKKNGHRFVANHADAETLRLISSGAEEKIGRVGRVRNDGKRNLFSLRKEGMGKL